MTERVLHLLLLALVLLGASAGDTDNRQIIQGGTDSTDIGNTGDRLKVDIAGSGIATISRQDVSGTFTATGNTAALESSGFGMMSVEIGVGASSGTGRTLDVEIQSSDDAANWTVLHDSQRFTTTGIQRFPGVRIAGRYYRFVYTIAGTTPSFTFAVNTTLKAYTTSRNVSLIRYGDLNLALINATSTAFNSQTCANVSLMSIRTGVATGTGTYAIQASNDNVNFGTIVASVSTSPLSLVAVNTVSGQAFAYYRTTTTATPVGAATLDLYWRCNGGS